MSRQYSLKQIREVWINAYLNGETDWLAYLETPSFFVKHNAELVSKASQISSIDRGFARFPGKRTTDVEFSETLKQWQEHKNWATVEGSARIKRNGEVVSQCEFFELWLIADDRWQIASLCMEDSDQVSPPR